MATPSGMRPLESPCRMLYSFLLITLLFQGTKDDPIIVNALDQYNMIGCACKSGDTTIQWMWVLAGRDKRCGCGYYFRLKEHATVDLYDMPA